LGENHITDQTGLNVLCGKVIEASWMALIVVVPLFFNIYSHRSFEPDKIVLMRSIAMVMALAWPIRMLEAGHWKQKANTRCPISNVQNLISRTPLILPTLLLAIVYILTTITSIAPRLSLWGSYHRVQGTYTALSYIVIFFSILYTLRHRRQLHRLITVVLLTSLPVSLYGIMQHYGLDPIAWTNIGAEVTVRAISTMGNPIFVAAYLIMVVPLTVGRLMQLLLAPRSRKRLVSLYVLGGCYVLLLASQLLCILFTQSRGPLLGLMGGMFFFFLLMAASGGRRKLALSVLGVVAVLLLSLAILSLSDTLFASIRNAPYLERLGGLLDLESRTAQQRILAWEGTTHLIAADPWRALIGYGPETMIVALNRHLPAELASLKPGEIFDRSHNEILDILATTGVVGLAAYLFFLGSLFYYSLKALGLIGSSRHRSLFILLYLAGGLMGGVLPRLLEGEWRFAGLGISVGILVALAIYLMISLFRQSPTHDFRFPASNLQILLIAFLSAILAHFIEIQFGIAIVATRALFWICAALVVVVGFYLQDSTTLEHITVPPASDRRRRSSAKRKRGPRTVPNDANTQAASLISYCLLVGLILATMGFALIGSPVNSQGQRWALLGFFVTVWLLCSAIAIIEAGEGIVTLADSIQRAPFLVSLGWFVAFLIAHVFLMQHGGISVLIFYYLYLFLTIIVVAIVLARAMPRPIRLRPGPRWWLYSFLIIGAGVLVFVLNLNPIRADILYKQGLAYANSGWWDESIARFERALKLAPGQDFYCLFLAGAYVEKAKTASDMAQRSALLNQARSVLERGRELSPLNPDPVSKLGLLYRVWGEMLTDLQERTEKLDQALEYYRQAQALRPHDTRILNEWGLVHFVKAEYDQAIDKYRRSLSIDSLSIQTHLLLGDAYRARGDFRQAEEAYRTIVEIAPEDFTGHKVLALLYEQMGRIEEAIAEAETALSLAPGHESAALTELVAHLKAQR